MAKSRIWGAETPKPIATKFCMSSAIQDVITPANFCEDRLRGFGVARGRILALSIDLLRRLYNTLALPCECVITITYMYCLNMTTPDIAWWLLVWQVNSTVLTKCYLLDVIRHLVVGDATFPWQWHWSWNKTQISDVTINGIITEY